MARGVPRSALTVSECVIVHNGRVGDLHPESGLEGAVGQTLFDSVEETCGVGPVNQPMVVGQGQVDDRANRDGVTVVAGEHHWTLDHAAGAEYPDLRLQ